MRDALKCTTCYVTHAAVRDGAQHTTALSLYYGTITVLRHYHYTMALSL